jgi:Flp pilus assembly protein TadD
VLLLLAVLATAPAVAASRPVDTAAAAIDVMALTPEIERFIEERVSLNQPRSARLRGLMSALFGKNGLDITYGNVKTKTAVETFESRSGNCLSFTILFVALARHVGLEAHFQEVGEILSWDRRGDVAVSNRHMFAEVETIEGMTRVDFLPGVEKRYRLVRRIDEQRVRAHYYSNLGAEALTNDDPELAMKMFTRAVEADETLAAAWVNMGVTHRRLGQEEAAERSYLRALKLDREEISAASNLANLYLTTGRERLAGPYLRKVKKHRLSNPFWHFQQGLDAAARGQLRTASRSLKKAVRLLPDDAMFRAELGKIQARAGRFRRAERSYVKALKLTNVDSQRLILEELLKQVRDSTA